ncbi:MAG: DUF4864 domain-containing protein [Alphaproteobacteria bacterium]|jgi:ketosteroid isomerase-like protein
MRRRVVLMVLAALTVSMSLVGASSSALADDATDIRTIIEDQTAAISAGDGQRAFGYATPMIQARMGSPEAFLRMVESGYSALIDPSVFRIDDVELLGDQAAARAHVVAKDGRVFKAVYPLKKQPSGEWRIDGCYLEPLSDRAV